MDNTTAFKTIENCLTEDTIPSVRLNGFIQEDWFHNYPFNILAEEENTKQSTVYHPEGNVWNHTLLVVDEAAKRKFFSSDIRVFMWAALLHDIGKPSVTKIRVGKITAYDHDRIGAELTVKFLSEFTDDMGFTNRVSQLVRYHMQIFYVSRNLPFHDIPGLRKNTNINDTALLGYCDRLGRTGADTAAEKKGALMFLRKCKEDTDVPWLRSEY